MESATTAGTFSSADPDPPCPLRPGGYCALCVPGASGPSNCGLVYLVMSDPDLRAQLNEVERHERDRS